MKIRLRTVLIGVTVIAGVATLLWENRSPPPRDHLFALRDSIRVLRVSVDSCRANLDVQSSDFEAFDARIDSLRERVRSLEAIHPRGVPADSYDIYLDAFDSYNDSVARWRQRADTVRARWALCRDLTELHNTMTDSLRRLLEERMGIDPPAEY